MFRRDRQSSSCKSNLVLSGSRACKDGEDWDHIAILNLTIFVQVEARRHTTSVPFGLCAASICSEIVQSVYCPIYKIYEIQADSDFCVCTCECVRVRGSVCVFRCAFACLCMVACVRACVQMYVDVWVFVLHFTRDRLAKTLSRHIFVKRCSHSMRSVQLA